MSDYISKLRDLLLQQSKTGRLSSLLDSIYGAASTGAEAYGAANSPMAPQHAAGLLGTIADLTPVVGDVKSAYEGVQAAREGDWAGAGLGLLGALPFVPGITAWHGSPHKFDKFSLDKIGTGEGAQAYGHGLYLAESPAVANQYLRAGKDIGFNNMDTVPTMAGKAMAQAGGNIEKAMAILDDVANKTTGKTRKYNAIFAKDSIKNDTATAHLYKTDIPDEAVARFLDWDKPLSQQAPEVQKMLEPLGYSSKAQVGAHDDALLAALTGDATTALPKIRDPMGSDIARGGGVFDGPGQVAKSEMLRKLGIPGIRYLDGGSRATGKGSSNFVVFDDQLPRILERNGVPTGNNPWGKGEWKPK